MISFGKFGYAPIYFVVAMLFFIGGGTLIYYGHPIIGVIVLIPGMIFLGLVVLILSLVYVLSRDNGGVELIMDDEKQIKKRESHRKRRERKKRN
ncbi:hypothetical protein QUF58_11270 [Anaerolineales bacterium HSG24]|nr:hypothetical protein [Anaerolineales bacterium HSG24]